MLTRRAATIVLTYLALMAPFLVVPKVAQAKDVAAYDVDESTCLLRTTRVHQRRAAGFGLTAAGAVPVLVGAILADAAGANEAAPLLASGAALQATGSAMLLPWTPNLAPERSWRAPTVRVTVAYRQGGVRIGVAGRF